VTVKIRFVTEFISLDGATLNPYRAATG